MTDIDAKGIDAKDEERHRAKMAKRKAVQDAEVAAKMVEKGLLKNTKTDVKLLGNGDLEKKLTVRVHAISATAREKVEKAGGTVSLC